MIQKDFQVIVDEAIEKCKKKFENRLSAIYMTGSIHVNEAIIGESDLDCWAFITDDLSDDDRAWLNETENEMNNAFEIIDGVHINVKSIEELRNDKFARFALKYNSTLCFGYDVISEIEPTGVDIYKPNKSIAKERLSFARKCLEDAMLNVCPQCMEKIPENTYFAARKYARYFILVEGVYYLMAKNKFETYKQEKVLQQLKENSTGFNEILDLSLAVLKDPLRAAIKHDDYIVQIYPFVMWLFEEIEKA